LEWSQIPEFWSSLQSLELSRCSGLSLTGLAQYLSQMTSLRLARLPFSIVVNDSAEFIEGISEMLMVNQTCAEFKPFDHDGSKFSNRCAFQPNVQSDDEDDTSDSDDDFMLEWL